MTCTESAPRGARCSGAVGRASGPIRGTGGVPEEAPVEADRQGAVAEERVVERPKAEPIAEPPLLVRAELEEQDLAEQVRQLVRRRVGVAVDLGPGVGLLEARLLDQELGRLLRR